MSQTLLYGPRTGATTPRVKDPALRRGLYPLEQAIEFELEESGHALSTWASDDSISVFGKDLCHSYNLGSWSIAGDGRGAQEESIEGWSYKIGEHRTEVLVFMPDTELSALRTDKKRGIKVEGRELDWFSALEAVARAASLIVD